MIWAILRYNVIIFAALILSSCSLLSPVKTCPPNIFLIHAQSHCDSYSKSKRKTSLLVMRPETFYPYDSMQIAYSRYPYQIGYFNQSKWGATPGQMLQIMLIQALQDTNHYRAVVGAPYAGNYQYYLTTQILTLLQDYACYPALLKLSVRVQITSFITNNIIASKQFDLVEPIYHWNAYSGVLATNRAMTRLLDQISYFAIKHT